MVQRDAIGNAACWSCCWVFHQDRGGRWDSCPSSGVSPAAVGELGKVLCGVLGPWSGEESRDTRAPSRMPILDSLSVFQIVDKNNRYKSIDGSDETKANWMR